MIDRFADRSDDSPGHAIAFALMKIAHSLERREGWQENHADKIEAGLELLAKEVMGVGWSIEQIADALVRISEKMKDEE